MRATFLLPALFTGLIGHAGICTIDLRAPEYAGEHVVLYLYSDLVTDRLVMVTQATIGPDGSAHLEAAVGITTKARLRVNIRHADLFLKPGAHYTISLPYEEAGPTTINGTMQLVPEFEDLDQFDVNALVSDLNTRIDAFLAEGLATDEDAGMQAVDQVRSATKDSLKATRPANVFVLPAPSEARVDTFEAKLRRFYKDSKDAWFWHYLDYSIAGLRIGPQASQKKLYERYVKGKAIGYSDPEQVRFIQNFFADHLMTEVFRNDPMRVKADVQAAATDSLMALFAKSEFLRDDRRLCELVMLMELYGNYHGKVLDRAGIERILTGISTSSMYVEHRTIAENMLWDLTWMRVGSTFPSLALRDVDGGTTQLDGLLEGPTCIVVTAAWCVYCDQELEALEKLRMEYGQAVRFVVIDVDSTWQTFTQYAKADKARDWTWLWAGDDPLFMDQLRLRNVPAYFLLNDRQIAYNPAPPPSTGMAPIFYKLKVEAEQKNKIRFDDDAPKPPRR